MKFGIGQFTLQIPPWDARDHAQLYADTLDLAELADRSGIDSFWLAEHHAASDGYIPALLPFLSAVAARTTRLEIGSAVMLAPFHHPLRVAEDAAVVDNISGGRLNLGLGLGWAPEEYRMFAVPTKGRGKRLDEFVHVVRAAWTKDRFSFDGAFYSYDDISITPKPARAPHPPIWLGGGTEAAYRRAAVLGDGYFPPSTTGGPEALVARAEEILALRKDAGLDGPYRFGCFVPVAVGRDADSAWESIRDGVMHVRGSYMLWAQQQRDVTGARDSVAGFEEQVRAGSIVGTAAEVVAQLRPLVDKLSALPFEEVFVSAILVPPGMDKKAGADAVERYANEVVPALH